MNYLTVNFLILVLHFTVSIFEERNSKILNFIFLHFKVLNFQVFNSLVEKIDFRLTLKRYKLRLNYLSCNVNLDILWWSICFRIVFLSLRLNKCKTLIHYTCDPPCKEDICLYCMYLPCSNKINTQQLFAYSSVNIDVLYIIILMSLGGRNI